MASKPYYITTAIPYVNARPHIGFALEIVQTDTFARYHRQRGEDVYFLTGSDENSLKNVQAAEAEGKLKKGHVQMVDATIFGGVYDAIKAGSYYGSVVQSPEDDAKTALRTAVMAAEGMSVPKKVFLPMPIVTSATIGTVARPSF